MAIKYVVLFNWFSMTIPLYRIGAVWLSTGENEQILYLTTWISRRTEHWFWSSALYYSSFISLSLSLSFLAATGDILKKRDPQTALESSPLQGRLHLVTALQGQAAAVVQMVRAAPRLSSQAEMWGSRDDETPYIITWWVQLIDWLFVCYICTDPFSPTVRLRVQDLNGSAQGELYSLASVNIIKTFIPITFM